MDDSGCFVQIIALVVVLVICASITYFVWNSDLPMWLKWLILR